MIDKSSEAYVCLLASTSFSQFVTLSSLRTKFAARENFTSEELHAALEGVNGWSAEGIDHVWSICGTNDANTTTIDRLAALCEQLELDLIAEVAEDAPEHIDHFVYLENAEPEGANDGNLGQSAQTQTTTGGTDDVKVVVDAHTTMRRIADRLSQMSEELSQFKNKSGKKELPEIDGPVKSLGKIGTRLHEIIAGLQHVEKSWSTVLQSAENSHRRIQELELANDQQDKDLRALAANYEQALQKLLSLENGSAQNPPQSADERAIALETQVKDLKVELELSKKRLEIIDESEEEGDTNRKLLEQIQILKGILSGGSEDEKAKLDLVEIKQQLSDLQSEYVREKKVTQSLQEEIEELKMKNQLLKTMKSDDQTESPQPAQTNTKALLEQAKNLRVSLAGGQAARESVFGSERRSTFNIRDSALGKFATGLSTNNYSRRKDYLMLHRRRRIQNDMVKYQEQEFSDECFSDSVFVLGANGKRYRSALVMTGEKIFLFSLENNWKLYFKEILENMTRISIASTSSAFLCIHFSTGKDVVIESFRRVEIIAYLSDTFRLRSLPMYKITVTKTIEAKAVEAPVKPKPSSKDADQPNKVAPSLLEAELDQLKKTVETPSLQEAIRFSRKSGFMRKMKKGGLFNTISYNEFFFLLADIGLVYFRKYGDLKSVGWISLLGGTVKTVPKSISGKDFTFCVKVQEGEKILQCYSQLEMEDWMRHIKAVQESGVVNKDPLKEMKKIAGM